MSGHNKWSKIKHKKGAADAEKSKIFGKMAKLITNEAKKAEGNRESPGLKAIIDKAKSVNMPNDNIERAIKRATESNAAALDSVVYEAYGPGGSAVIITGLTDNKNRTVAEIKKILSTDGGQLADPGAAAWAFEKSGDGTYTPTTPLDLSDEDSTKLQKLVGNLEDHDDVQGVFTNAN